MTTTPTPQQALDRRFPVGSTVRYQDKTLHGASRPKARTGEVVSTGHGANGVMKVAVRMKGGELTTLPENLTLLRLPNPENQHQTDIIE